MVSNLITEDISEKLSFLLRHQTLSAFVIFILLSIYALNANPFTGETVAPFDRLMQFPGWATIESDRTAVNRERSDILDSQLPTWVILKDQIRNGESPLWYPTGGGGEPISFELFNPAFLIFVLIKDHALAYYVVGLSKLVISGFGGYLLLKIFVRWLPSMWGGLVFMLCGFNAAWFFWEQVTTAMWIPWLLWATVRYLKTNDKKWLPAVTIFSLLLIFGGFPAVAAFGFYAFSLLILVWNAYDFFSNKPLENDKITFALKPILIKTALPLLAVIQAFLMSAIAIIPFKVSMSGINLGYRTGGTQFKGINDLLLFFSYENPSQVERTAYVGIMVLTLSLIGIFSVFGCKNINFRRFILFNFFLTIISALITFGLLPHELIRALPVLKSNQWGRLVVLPLLGLAILSAAGLDFLMLYLPKALVRYLRLTPANAGRTVVVLLIVMTAAQFHSQKILFNSFNSVVPEAWFYPLTPDIKYVKENLRPLQSVIADVSAYWFSGTLGAYDIAEWFAHSFKTDKEKEVLSKIVHDPFASATASAIFAPNIQYHSPLMDKLVIKYVLVNKEAFRRKSLLEFQELSREPAPPLPRNSWRQHIYIPKDMSVGAIGFFFALPPGDSHAPAKVRLTLYNDKGGKYLVNPKSDKAAITADRLVYFVFPDELLLSEGGYYLEISLPGYTGPGGLSAWATKTNGDTGSFLEVNGTKTDLSLIWKIGYLETMDPAVIADKWKLIDLGTNILIFENKSVTNSIYFLRDLVESNNRLDFSGLSIREALPDRIEIDNLKKEAGWIVLPISLHPGWKAYVNGRSVKYDTYLDILPAIPVDGPSLVTFKYEPKSFQQRVTR